MEAWAKYLTIVSSAQDNEIDAKRYEEKLDEIYDALEKLAKGEYITSLPNGCRRD